MIGIRPAIIANCRRSIQCDRILGRSSQLLYSDAAKLKSHVKDGAKSNILTRYLKEYIKAFGPISLATYMQQCLMNPTAGYYVKQEPFGAKGDFITSPEISQMFGEMVAIWCMTEWLAQGQPKKVSFIELGPGRGTLMADMLRSTKSFSEFANSVDSIHLIESSPALREEQQNLLIDVNNKRNDEDQRDCILGSKLYWHDSLDFPLSSETFPLIIAHEFFDALPIYKFERENQGWRECLIDNQEMNSKGENTDEFRLVKATQETFGSQYFPKLSPRYAKLSVGSSIEISSSAMDYARAIRQVMAGRGATLIIDYGNTTIPVDTLRAIKSHKFVSPYRDPGLCDLSTDVDFTGIAEIVVGDGSISAWEPVEQGLWLQRMGIAHRAASLADVQKSSLSKGLVNLAFQRLIDVSPQGMGKLYKLMALTNKRTSPPVGFGGIVPSIGVAN